MQSFLLYLCLVIGFMVAAGEIAIKSRKIDDIPNPFLNPLECNRKSFLSSSICDPDNLMMEIVKNRMEQLIKAISSKAEVAVAIIEKMDTRIKNIDMVGSNYAEQLHSTWKVGTTEKDNGILLFISIHDQVVSISAGEKVKNPEVYSQIISSMKTKLRNNDHGTALLIGLGLLQKHFNGEKLLYTPETNVIEWLINDFLRQLLDIKNNPWFLVVILTFFAAIVYNKRSGCVVLCSRLFRRNCPDSNVSATINNINSDGNQGGLLNNNDSNNSDTINTGSINSGSGISSRHASFNGLRNLSVTRQE